MWPFGSKNEKPETSPYRTPGREINEGITAYSEFSCSPNKSDVDLYKPPPVEDTSTALEKIQQGGCWALVFTRASFFSTETKIPDAAWKVVVYVRGEKRDLFLTEKDMAHLSVILEPGNRAPWIRDGIFGFERPGMKFYVQSYMAPLVLQALKTCKRDEELKKR